MLDEQPMPLMVMTSWGWNPSSAIACFRAASTPKSPHPGHQSGSTLPLRSLTVSFGRSGFAATRGFGVSTTLIVFSSHHHFVDRYIDLGLAGQDLLHAVRDVMRHERPPVVL